MSTTVKTGWLKDNNGEKFAPKTLSSQIQDNDGTLFEDKIQDSLNTMKSEILNNISIEVDSALSSTSTNPVQNKVLDAEFEAIATSMNALDEKLRKIDDIPAAAFYITLNSSDMTVDKSDAEIEAAYQAGRSIFCLFPQAGGIVTCPLSMRSSESLWVFSMVGLLPNAENALAGYLVISGGKCISSDSKSLANYLYDTLPNPYYLGIDGTTYDGSEVVRVGNTIHYIVGDSTTAGTWTGTCSDITKYYDGLTIAYKTNMAGISGGTTLNINGLGAISVRRNASTAVTTTYPVGSVLLLTYSTTDGVGYWLTADYDANTKTTAGSSNKTATKMFLIGGTSQSSSGVTTYSNTKCYIGTDNRLYSGGAVVPNTDEINALIDTKLGVIENGSY